MSSTNTETLTLYKNPKIYNGSRYKYYQTDRDYNAYLLEQDPEPYEKTVYFKSLTEPIILDGAIKNYDEYTYGKITNDGKEYYIFIDNITTFSNKRTTIKFSVDWWSTNWSKINCTKAHLTRSSSKPNYMPQPFTPMYSNASIINEDSNLTYESCIIFSYINDIGDNDYMSWGAIDFKSKNSEHIDILNALENGQWQAKLGLPPSSILGAYIVPLFGIEYFKNAQWIKHTKGDIEWYSSDENGSEGLEEIEYSVKETLIPLFTHVFNTTEKKVEGISDWNGNTIWECPYGVSIEKFRVELNLSTQNVMLRFKPIINDNAILIDELTGKGFTYNCRKLSLFVDYGEEYTWRDKDVETRMRNIQSMKQVWSAASDAIQGAGFGIAFGGSGLFGERGKLKQVPGMQSGWGLESALAGGIINTASTWIMNSIFDPEIEALQQLKYTRMHDEMSVIGDGITPIYKDFYNIREYYLTVFSAQQEVEYITDTQKLYDKIRELSPGAVLRKGEIVRLISPYMVYTDWSLLEEKSVNSILPYNMRCNYFTYTDSGLEYSGTYQVYVLYNYRLGDDNIEYNDAPSYLKELFQERYGYDVSDNDIILLFSSLNQIPATQTRTVIEYIYNYKLDTDEFIELCYFNQPEHHSTDHSRTISYQYPPDSISYQNVVNELVQKVIKYISGRLLIPYVLSMDNETKTRMDNDINSNGYYCDESISNLQSKFGVNNKVQAENVTIEGNCCVEGKQQVVYRLMKGVEFI